MNEMSRQDLENFLKVNQDLFISIILDVSRSYVEGIVLDYMSEELEMWRVEYGEAY